jgi:hypothetical protein
VWYRKGTDPYVKFTEVAVGGSPVTITGLLASTTYDVALRYRRGTSYTAGYEDPVTGGWTGTALTQSKDSIATAAAPAAPDPTDVHVSAYDFQTYGSKTYESVKVTWTNQLAAGSGIFYRLYQHTADDPGAATQLASGLVVGGVGSQQTLPSFVGSWLITTQDRYLWLRVDNNGILSNPVEVTPFPLELGPP